MKKKTWRNLLICICLVSMAGCSSSEQNRGNDDADVTDSQEEDPYQVQDIEISEKEKEKIESSIYLAGGLCKDIYIGADKGESSNIVLDEETVHKMTEAIASQGLSATCGSYDYNMLNYEKVDKELRDAAEGKVSETGFYEITTSGYIRYWGVKSENLELTVTYANASFNEEMELQIRQIEKFKAYDWEYTEKGWLIWEKALSQNEEMDMHSFFRILPLEEKCREFGNKYIRPVSYFCNNVFLVNWDVDSMDKIEFNDLYDFLYEMKFGRNLDEEKMQAGIEKGEFESVIQTFFDISQEELESFARYNSQQGIYPWEPIGAWNRVQQFQPFPEVVKCTENQDGTWTLFVEAIFVEKGSDCYFKHTVTMKEEDGRWIYTGNRIEEGEERLPGYKPRREF